jgi:hypothetical protein
MIVDMPKGSTGFSRSVGVAPSPMNVSSIVA